MRKCLRAVSILGWSAGAKIALAAIPGAMESFPALEHADSWSVFDYRDETVYYPEWLNEGDPYIYFSHDNGEALWFFSDHTGSADWLGDYEAEDIQSIQVDVLIDSLEDFDELDCAVLTNGPAGRHYYYSESFFDSDFPDSGWWILTFDLNTTWYYFDGTWNPVEMEAQDFREVEEIGFRFFLKAGTTAELFAAIDEVRLEPLVRAPDLDYSATATDFLLEFIPRKANTCSIEKLSAGPTSAWETITGQTDLRGPEAHLFSTPLSGGRGIFRVKTEAAYTQVVIE